MKRVAGALFAIYVTAVSFQVCLAEEIESASRAENAVDSASSEIERDSIDRDEITKWCKKATGSVQFTTDHVSPKGFEPCGELQNVALCDALGNKYIGPRERAPLGYQKCGLKRIYIEKNGEEVDVARVMHGDRDTSPRHVEKRGTLQNNAVFEVKGPQQNFDQYLDNLGKLADQKTPESSHSGPDLSSLMTPQVLEVMKPFLENMDGTSKSLGADDIKDILGAFKEAATVPVLDFKDIKKKH